MVIRDLLMAAESFAERVFERVSEALNASNIHDVNSTQAMLLRRLGSDETTVGNLPLLQCYVGTNVSYNIKSLIDNGYLSARVTPTDRRVRLVKATENGLAIGHLVMEAEVKCIDRLGSYGIPADALEDVTKTLKKVNGVLG